MREGVDEEVRKSSDGNSSSASVMTAIIATQPAMNATARRSPPGSSSRISTATRDATLDTDTAMPRAAREGISVSMPSAQRVPKNMAPAPSFSLSASRPSSIGQLVTRTTSTMMA